jgi:hypothetical protein
VAVGNGINVTTEDTLGVSGKIGIGIGAPNAKLHINASSGDMIIGQNSTGTVFKVANSGEVFSDVAFSTPAADVAERMPISGEAEEGDVVVIDTEADETLIKSTKSYDTLVAGIVSTKPGIKLGEKGEYIALAGRVPVKVTGEVNRGDLLVTSDEPGKAMRCEEKERCAGAIIGKAPTEDKDGRVVALVSLQ